MFNDVIVIDDAIPKAYQDHIENCIRGDSFPWYWVPEVVSYDMGGLKPINDTWIPSYGFSHMFYCRPINQQSSYCDMIFPLLLMACDAAKIKNPDILRIRAGLITRIGDRAIGKHHLPHIDLPGLDHTTMVYYPIETGGETHMFDKVSGQELEGGTDRFTTVTPKKGRLVFFNGLRYHASSNPIDNDFRVVIHANLTNYPFPPL